MNGYGADLMNEQQQQTIKKKGKLRRQKNDASETGAQGAPITIQEICWLTIVYNRRIKTGSFKWKKKNLAAQNLRHKH